MAAVVAAAAEVGRDPEHVVRRAGAGHDHVDDPVVAVQVDLHFAVRVEVDLPRIARLLAVFLAVELQAAAAPDGQEDLVVAVVGDAVVPDLFHGGVLLGEDRPLPGLRVVAAGPGGGRRPDVVVLHGDRVDDVVDQAAVELVEMVEASAAEAGQTAAEQPQPDVAGLRVDVDGGDDLPRQAVFSPSITRTTLPCLLVDQRQAVLGADPDAVAVGLDREDVVVGQPVLDGEVLPLGVDVGQFVGAPPPGAVWPRRRDRPKGSAAVGAACGSADQAAGEAIRSSRRPDMRCRRSMQDEGLRQTSVRGLSCESTEYRHLDSTAPAVTASSGTRSDRSTGLWSYRWSPRACPRGLYTVQISSSVAAAPLCR